MAITKIHAIKSTLSDALTYIMNPEKTENEVLISGYNVEPKYAATEFAMTEILASAIKHEQSEINGARNLAYHMIQSFAPWDNITPEQAHQIGKQWADELLGGMYEYVISTHVDKGHIHNHIIFNATSFYTHNKYVSVPYKTVKQLRQVSDRLCYENGLNVTDKSATKGIGHFEWQKRTLGDSWKEKIEQRIDEVIGLAVDFQHFKKLLHDTGVEIKEGKHLAYKIMFEGQEKFVRGKTIGERYTREGILDRIANKTQEKDNVQDDYPTIIKRQSLKSKLENTHLFFEALNTVSREDIKNYDDFTCRLEELESKIGEVKTTIETLETKNLQYKEAAKYLMAVQRYAPVAEKLEGLKPSVRERFIKNNQQELEYYKHAVYQLEKINVNLNVDPDKVVELVKSQDAKTGELSEALKVVEERAKRIQQAQRVVDSVGDRSFGKDVAKGKAARVEL